VKGYDSDKCAILALTDLYRCGRYLWTVDFREYRILVMCECVCVCVCVRERERGGGG
jgi:hypothetical protein